MRPSPHQSSIRRRILLAFCLTLIVALLVAPLSPFHAVSVHADDNLTLNPTSGPPGVAISITPNQGAQTYPSGYYFQPYYSSGCSGNSAGGTALPVNSDGTIPTLSLTIPITETAPCASVVVLVGVFTSNQPDAQLIYAYGPYPFTITGSSAPTATPTPVATSAPMPAVAVHGAELTAVAGTALTQITVGYLTDPVPHVAGDYQASIDWGDGQSGLTTAATAATLLPRGSSSRPDAVVAVFLITGSHTYAAAGVYPINVTIGVSDGRYAYLTSIAHVSAGGGATGASAASAAATSTPARQPK